jgi:hypothetical protein
MKNGEIETMPAGVMETAYQVLCWRMLLETGANLFKIARRSVMGFLEEAEKIAGAVAAVEGMKKLDPNAGFLTEAAAAITGYEAAGAVAEHFEKKDEDKGEQQS